MIKLSNQTYNFLKWAILIVVPAFIAFLTTYGTIYGFDFTKETAFISAVAAFFGVVTGISNYNYDASEDPGVDKAEETK